MSDQFLLPDVGEGLTEAEIVAWHVKVGDTVAVNDVICDIETAKSVVELPSPFAGTVEAILVAVGDTVEVGSPIIRIGDGTAAVAAPAPAPASAGIGEIDLSNPAASGGGEGESLVGRAKADRGPQRRRRRGAATPRTEAGANTQLQVQGAFSPGGAQSAPVAESDEPAVPAVSAPPAPARVAATDPVGRVLAKPLVRRVARDLGVDLASVEPTGPNGSVSKEDVLAAAAGPAAPAQSEGEATAGPRVPAPPGVAAAGETREPVRGVVKMMARAMTDSAFSVPHVTEWITLDMSASLDLLDDLRGRREFRDVKLTPLLLVARACLVAMRRNPLLNSWFDADAGESGEIVHRSAVNLGIAAATPRGLVVPNIKGADGLDVLGLARALADLTATAKDGRTQPAEMAGGTFTLTNVGVFGVDAGTPIINPGESAILAIGALNRRPWVVGEGKKERLEIRDVTTLALSFDHRHVDGAAGSAFLADVASVLTDPRQALLL